MAGFKDYKGTPFVPFLLPIIPKGEQLSPDSTLTQDMLGKIPGLRSNSGDWSGFDWPRFLVRDGSLDVFASWYANRPCETVAINARELLGVDSDGDNPVIAKIVRETLDDVLGISCERIREGSFKFLRCYRLAETSARVTKKRDVVQDNFGTRYPCEILADGQQWLMEGEHPSGTLYEWAGTIRPLDLGWEHIPQVTSEQVHAFRVELRKRLLEAGFTPAKGIAGAAHVQGEHFAIGVDHPGLCPDMAMLERALAFVPCDCDELVEYDDWFNFLVGLKTACGGSEAFYDEVAVPWAAAVPDNVDILRGKWESIDVAHLGWDYVASVAQTRGFNEHITSKFEALPYDINQTSGPPPRNAPADAHSVIADEFVARHGRKTHIYVPELKIWRAFDDGVWERDDTPLKSISDFCRSVGQGLLNAAMTKEQRQAAKVLFNEPAAAAVSRLVRSNKGFLAHRREFDSRPYLIGVPGGYIDEDGRLRDPDPGLMLSRRARYAPDYGVPAPRFCELVKHLSNYDPELERAMQLLLGYTLCGTASEKVFPFLHGPRSNEGKSQLMKILNRILGGAEDGGGSNGYARRAATETFMQYESAFAKRTFDLSDLDGYWFVYVSEIDRRHTFNEPLLKDVTGGDDVYAEAKYQVGRDMRVRFCPWFVANHFPRVINPDTALRGRAAIFRCERVIADDKKDPNFAEHVVTSEGPGIMAQLLRWRAEYRKAGRLYLPRQMIELRERYFGKSDKLRQFLTSQGTFASDGVSLRQTVYERYKAWCKDNIHRPESQGEFYERLEDHELFRQNGCEFRKKRLEPGRLTSPQHLLIGWRLWSLEELGAFQPLPDSPVEAALPSGSVH